MSTSKHRVLVLGSGAREHALIVALSKSPSIEQLYALPGNAGIAGLARCLPGRADDVRGVVETVKQHGVDFVVVGPEAPLCAGVVDALAEAGVLAFGPRKQAAELENSKAFSKEFMRRHHIATSDFAVFTDAEAAQAYLREQFGKSPARERGLVVKADGLAAGKGVVVADTLEEALEAVDTMMKRRAFGPAGDRIVIEERVFGAEVSFHAISDGQRFVPLAAAQDHKRIYEGDRGPNTGGMGAYSPPITVSPALHERIVREVVAPTIAGMASEGCPFRGTLFAGLMLGEPDAQGDRSISVLEFNVRFGDPETAVLMARLDTDLFPYLYGAARGDLGALADAPPPVLPSPALAVVLAAAGYPASVRTGDRIGGLVDAMSVPNVTVLHAGTSKAGTEIVTSGGRVLCVTARGDTIDAAADHAYRAVEAISFDGMQLRRDIAASARKPVGAR